MKTSRRFVALALTTTLFLSTLLSGCNATKVVPKDAVYVSDDTNWYTVQKNYIGTEYDRSDYIFWGQSIVGKYEDMYVFKTEGKTKNYLEDDYDGRVLNLDFCSEDGKLVKSVDMMHLAYEQPELEDAMYLLLNSFYFDGSDIKLSVDGVFYNTTDGYYDGNFEYVFDYDSSSLKSVGQNEGSEYAINNGGVVNLGAGYSIIKYWSFDGSNSVRNVLEVKSPDGSTKDINLANVFPNATIGSIDCIFGIDDETAIVGVTDAGTYQRMWFTINLPTAKYEIYEGDMGWVSSVNPESITYISGQGCYALDTDGIKKLDFDARTLDIVVDFNECNINRFDIPYLKIYSVTDDEAILAGSVYTNVTGVSEETNSYVYKISKCDTNPNIGKEIITLASTRDMDEAIAQAIFEFNQNSSEYFVVFDSKYSLTKYLYEHSSEATGDVAFDTYETQSKLNAMLTQDLMAGEGPDIIINAFDCNMINRRDCLMDLTSYAKQEDGLLKNVLDAAKEDGKLYQIPVSFGVKGIVTSSSNVNKQGFTFDEYSEFVSDVCNGKDPLKMNRIDFLDEVLASMNDLIIKHGGDNSIDTKAIKAAAKYANDNVPEYYYDPFGEISGATYAEINGFASFLLGEYTNGGFNLQDLTVVGLPSIDRRGPTIVVTNSMAIAADVNNPDACWSFCQRLLDDDIQKMFFATGTPIKESVLISMCDEAINAYNNMREAQIADGSDELLLYQLGMSLPASHSYTEKYVDIIRSCSVISNSYDATVKMLIHQEIQPYFAGDKTLDEVCNIAKSEIKIYKDERE
ncbi:MAG: hypothetical protein MJ166_02180 [Clostridia bacterium]|nr:hypothetical protein [Clostridia bacterium]